MNSYRAPRGRVYSYTCTGKVMISYRTLHGRVYSYTCTGKVMNSYRAPHGRVYSYTCTGKVMISYRAPHGRVYSYTCTGKVMISYRAPRGRVYITGNWFWSRTVLLIHHDSNHCFQCMHYTTSLQHVYIVARHLDKSLKIIIRFIQLLV